MAYPIEIDQEILLCETTYSVFIKAELEYGCEEDPEPIEVVITDAEIKQVDGLIFEEGSLPLEYEGGCFEKIITEDPDLTIAVDGLLWDEIQKHTEDNYRDIMRDLQDARDDCDL